MVLEAVRQLAAERGGGALFALILFLSRLSFSLSATADPITPPTFIPSHEGAITCFPVPWTLPYEEILSCLSPAEKE